MVMIFPPKSLDLMNHAEVECCAYGRVEKHSTATGLPKGIGRLIHQINLETLERYYLPRHLEYDMCAYYLDQFLGAIGLKANKYDVTGAFRNVAQCIFGIGDIAGELSGHTAIEDRGIFGLNLMPLIYHSSATLPIHKRHKAK